MPLLGGALIGLSASVLLLVEGRVAGVSGILAGALDPAEDRGWRGAFLLGLIGCGAVIAWWAPSAIGSTLERPLPVLAAAGLLVGFGTRWSGGCTSGHGVCGLSRGSTRSLVAVLTFMVVGVATATAWRLLGGAS